MSSRGEASEVLFALLLAMGLAAVSACWWAGT
jgi:hypothetical protein